MGDSEMLGAKLDNLVDKVAGMESNMTRLADAMVQLARLEVQFANNSEAVKRAFDAIEKLHTLMSQHIESADERMRLIEEAQPVQKLVSNWVLAWIAGVVGLLGGAVAAKVLGH